MAEVFRYPYEAITDTTDYLQIDAQEYVPVSNIESEKPYSALDIELINNSGLVKYRSPTDALKVELGNNRGGNSRKRLTKEKGTVFLPIPSNIQDGNAVTYADDSLNGIVAAAIGPITGMMESVDPKNPSAIMTKFSGNLQQLANLGLSQDVQRAIGRSLASQAVGIFNGNVTPDSILARQSGEIFNPNMELLFNGVTLRAFKFQFKLTPRNNNEAIEIRNIIRFFKLNMSPTGGVVGNFLATPNVFQLTYKKGNEAHPFLHKFKLCALESVSVNYTGENVYATYNDATPISMIMDLSFKELQPIYSADYVDSNNTDSTVGY